MNDSDAVRRLRAASEWAYYCDRCGEPMEERHCKIVCPRCAYTRDCSDP